MRTAGASELCLDLGVGQQICWATPKSRQSMYGHALTPDIEGYIRTLLMLDLCLGVALCGNKSLNTCAHRVLGAVCEHLVMSLSRRQLAPESHVFVHLAGMVCQALHYVQYACDCISS